MGGLKHSIDKFPSPIPLDSCIQAFALYKSLCLNSSPCLKKLINIFKNIIISTPQKQTKQRNQALLKVSINPPGTHKC